MWQGLGWLHGMHEVQLDVLAQVVVAGRANCTSGRCVGGCIDAHTMCGLRGCALGCVGLYQGLAR
jgi:hypothetical protein